MPLATTHDTVMLQGAINSVVTTAGQLLATSELLRAEMRKVDEHNVSELAHPDMRQSIVYVTDQIDALKPHWDSEGNYTGPVGIGISDEMVVGIEFLSEDDMSVVNE